MSEAAVAAQMAELAALDARCAASPREAALFTACLRTITPIQKLQKLHNSVVNNHAALVRLLLAHSLSPNTISPHGSLSLLHLAALHGSIDVLRLLMEAGADANCCSPLGHTPLCAAIDNGQAACARELIPHTNLCLHGADGLNVLHSSIIGNHLECFKLLLPHFADNIDVRSSEKRAPFDPDGIYNATPLMLACEGGHHAMVKALLAAGASRTAHDNTSFSCLHSAARNGHLACVTLLIGRPDNQKMSPAEIDATDERECTALNWAALGGHRYCCAVLLAAGADVSKANCDGNTALDVAKEDHPSNQELIELLECRGGGPAPLLCAGCGASDKRLCACSACQSASFCSAACLAQAWTTGTHKGGVPAHPGGQRGEGSQT